MEEAVAGVVQFAGKRNGKKDFSVFTWGGGTA